MLQYLLSMAIFGTIGLFAKNIDLPASLVCLVRGVVGALFLLAVLVLSRRNFGKEAVRANLKQLILSGAFLGGNWIFLFAAYKWTSLASATLAYYMAPVILILFSPAILKEKLSAFKIICAMGSLLGMSLVSGVWTAPADGVNATGVLLAFGAACFYACVVFSNKFVKGVDGYDSAVMQLAVAAVVLLPYVLLTVDFGEVEFSTQSVLLTFAVAFIHTGLAYWLYFCSLQKLTAVRIAICSYIDPAIALMLSVVVLHEPMTFASGIGAVLILGCALVSELAGMRKKSETQS